MANNGARIKSNHHFGTRKAKDEELRSKGWKRIPHKGTVSVGFSDAMMTEAVLHDELRMFATEKCCPLILNGIKKEIYVDFDASSGDEEDEEDEDAAPAGRALFG